MIKSFQGKETAKIWQGHHSRTLPGSIQPVARRKLRMLNNANALDDLRIPPRNRLERLKGDRAGQHSIRINDQWRICFVWKQGDAFDVEITDYHLEVNDMTKLPKIHPGEVLLEEFLQPMNITQNRLARDIGVPPRRINEIVHGNRSVTADTALRLARYFGTSEAFWMGLQADYDLEEARNRLGDRLEQEVRRRAA